MIVLLFVLATIGMTNIIMYGMIFDDDHLGFTSWLRCKLDKYFSAGDMLDCQECTGFWCGLIMGFLLLSFNPIIFVPAAFAGSGIMRLYSAAMNFIESKTDFVIGDDNETETTA